MNCLCCGKVVRPAEEILSKIDSLYMACPHCPPEPGLDKSAPLHSIGERPRRCGRCGRAPLDLVMSEALEVLVDLGLRDQSDNLRSVGSPLVEVGYPLAYPPRLGEDDLIIVANRLNKTAAEELVKIPEVKGVIQGNDVPGVVDLKRGAKEWKLLAGCDLRCDVVQSLFGELVVYKNQSKIHIEFSRDNAPKMRILEHLYFRGGARNVADCLCGPGTLGLVSVLAGARRVIMNDVWRPAVENVVMNIEANRQALGIEDIERVEEPVADLGSEPILVALAHGGCTIEVYHGDAERLFSRAEPAEVCLVDPFPGAYTKDIVDACRSCGRVVVV